MNAKLLLMDRSGESRRDLLVTASARALAFFFGTFSLVNIVGSWRVRNFDATLWWIDLRVLPPVMGTAFLLVASLSLLAFAWRPPGATWRRVLTGGIAAALAAGSIWNILEYYSLLLHNRVWTAVPVPFSAFVLGAMVLIFRANGRHARPNSTTGFSKLAWAGLLACVVLFPVAQMFLFGETDYRRPADVAVVFGARAYKDGRPSDALSDRVATACQLYRDGLVKKIIFRAGLATGRSPSRKSCGAWLCAPGCARKTSSWTTPA